MRRRALLTGGRKKEHFHIPYADTSGAFFSISTRGGDMLVDWGDGSSLYNHTDYKLYDWTVLPKSYILHNYSPNFTGIVTVIPKKGLKDVYSVLVGNPDSNNQRQRYDIQDFGAYINQFPNLYSIFIDFYNYQNVNNQPVIKGDLAEIPKTVKRYQINTFDSQQPRAILNLSNFPADSELEEIWNDFTTGVTGYIQITGDLALIPANVRKFGFAASNRHRFTDVIYTGGRVWPAEFDSLEINKTNTLTVSETDAILEDLANSVTTAIGDKKITLSGCITTKLTEIEYLESLGFTVTVGILTDPKNSLHHHLKTKTANPLKDEAIISGASWGLAGTTADISYPVGGGINNADKGRVELSTSRLGSLCDKNGDIPFSIVLRIIVDSLPATNLAVIVSKDQGSSNREFQFALRPGGEIRLNRFSGESGANTSTWDTTTQLSANTEYHIAVTCAGGKPIKIYIDAVEDTLTDVSVGTYTKMIPTTAPLKLFALFAANYEFKGTIKDLRIYRYRELTQQNITDLYNGDEDTIV